MSNTHDLVNSALNKNLQEFRQHFSKVLAERSVDFLGARSTNLSKELVTECECGCDAPIDEVKTLHQDTHKIKKTRNGYQLFIYSPSTGKFIAQGPPHKTKRAAEKDARKFLESLDEEKATSRNIVKGLSDADGPFTVVAIKNNKVIKQEGTKMKNMLPAIVKEMRKDVGRGVTISIEDRKGTIRSTFKEQKINEAVKSVDQKIAINVYNKLKKGDKVRVNFGNVMSMNSKPIELVVTSPHRIVGKSKVGRIILKNPKNMGGVKYTLYNRGGKVSLAQGDMGTVLKDIQIIKESNLYSIAESARTKMPVDIDIDGNIVHVTPDVSERIVDLHDELNESNQKDMIKLLESDTSSFLKLVKFTQER